MACIIGLLHHRDYSELITLDELKEHIEEQKRFNSSIRADALLRDCKALYTKEYTLKQYADARRSTDLTRFEYCPDCGAKICWEEIRKISTSKNA